jgi:GNAT superfamily N-acetyltransferase
MRTPAQVLAAAFHDDAMFVFIEPDGERRRRVLPWFFGAALRLGRQLGRVDVEPDVGAAIWLRPGSKIGVPAAIRSGLVLAPLHFGLPALKRFGALTSAFEEAGARVHGDRYWHLFILGVAPDHQGQGVGRRLVTPVLAAADAAGERCYLETLEERNLPFYSRLGFAVGEEVAQPGLPRFWAMVREPRGVQTTSP